MKGKSATWELMQGVMDIFSVDMNVQIKGAPMMDPAPILPINMDLSHPELPLIFNININNPFGMVVKMENLVFEVFLYSDKTKPMANGTHEPLHMGAIKLQNNSLSLQPFSKDLYPFSLFLDIETYQKGSIIGPVLNASSQNQSLPDFVLGQVDLIFGAPKENTDPFKTTLEISTDQIRPMVSTYHVENVQMSGLDFIFKLNLSQTEFLFDVDLRFFNPFGVSIFARKLDFQVYLFYEGQFYLAGSSNFVDHYANWTLEPNAEAKFVTHVKAYRPNIDNGVLLNIAGNAIALQNGSVQGYAIGNVEVEVDGAMGHVEFVQRDVNAHLLEMKFEDGVIINGTIKILSTDAPDDDPNPIIYIDSEMLFQNPLGAILNITHMRADVNLLDLRASKVNPDPKEEKWVYCMTVERIFQPVWSIPGNAFKSFVTRVNMSTDDFNQREIGLIAMSTALIYGYVPARVYANITLELENGTTLQIPYYHPRLPIYPLFN